MVWRKFPEFRKETFEEMTRYIRNGPVTPSVVGMQIEHKRHIPTARVRSVGVLQGRVATISAFSLAPGLLKLDD